MGCAVIRGERVSECGSRGERVVWSAGKREGDEYLSLDGLEFSFVCRSAGAGVRAVGEGSDN